MEDRLFKLLHPDAKLPIKKHELDAGADHYLIQDLTLKPRGTLVFPLGIAAQIKPGELLTIRSRSSTKLKGVSCAQTTCDPGYTGELYGFLINHTDQQIVFKKGERVVQLTYVQLAPNYNCKIAETLPDIGERKDKRFGSTGIN